MPATLRTEPFSSPPCTPTRTKTLRSRPDKLSPMSSSISSFSPTSVTASMSSFSNAHAGPPLAGSLSPKPNPPSDSSCSSTTASSSSDASPENDHDSDSQNQNEELQLPVLLDDALHEDLQHLILQPEAITDELAQSAAEAALKKVLDFHSSSSLPDKVPSAHNGGGPMALKWEDVTIERLLGVGGFCCVTLARIPKLEQRLTKNLRVASVLEELSEESFMIDEEEEEVETDDNAPLERHNAPRRRPRNSITEVTCSPQGKYALKCLNKTSVSSPKRFVRAAQGLAYEATMLSHLDHQNIIKIHGIIGECDAATFRRPGGYFLVLQCMRRTLDDVLRTWRKREGSDSQAAMVPSVLDRLSTVALGIAKGMSYLHDNKIVFRDLKPHNVGIDFEGNVRIFDFGIAKELQGSNPGDLADSGSPRRYPVIKGCVGSLRYMAPEVLVQHQASYPSDVYSFAILLWQLCVLKKPYGSKMHTAGHFKQYVGQMNVRPTPIPLSLDASIKNLIVTGWNEQPHKRPTFKQVIRSMELIIERGEAPVSSNEEDISLTSSPPSPRRHSKILSKLVPSFMRRKTQRRTAPSCGE